MRKELTPQEEAELAQIEATAEQLRASAAELDLLAVQMRNRLRMSGDSASR